MSGNLGNATLSLDVNDSRLIGGLNKALAQVKAMGAQMATAYGQSGNAAGQAFTQGVNSALKTLPSAGNAVGSQVGTSVRSGILGKIGGIGSDIGNTLKKSTSNIGQGIGQGIGQSITNGLASGLAGIAGALGNIKNLSEFDAASRKASTLSTDMGTLKKGAFELARELGNTTTASKILDSSYDVLSSGFSKSADVLAILKAAQIGAVGGFGEINQVANATTSVLNAYGLKAKDAASIVQQMAGTQNAGKLTIAEYADNIGKLASTAAQAGVPLQQINGIISVATAKGVRVSSAFDGVRAAMSAVLKPSGDATKAAKELGIGFDSGALKSKGLVGILQELTAKGKATPEILLKLFGSVEAVAAIAPIAGDGLKDYAKALETIKNTDAKDAFDKVSKGIEQQQKAFGNRAIDLDVKIKTGFVGEALGAGLSIANSAMDGLISAVERLNQAYSALSPQAQGIVKGIGAIAAITASVIAGIVAVGTAVALLGGAITAGVAALGAFVAGASALLVAFAPVVIPIAAAGAAVYALAQAMGATDTQSFTAALVAMGAGLAVVFGPAAIGAVAAGVTALVTGFGSIAVAAAAALVPLLPWIALAAGVAAALYLLYKAFEAAKPTLQAWGAAIKGAIDTAIAATVKFASDIGKSIKAGIDWFVRLSASVGNLLGAIANTIGNWVSRNLGFIADWARAYIDINVRAFNLVKSLVSAALNGIANGFNSMVGAVTGAISKYVGQSYIWQAATRGMADITKWLWDRSVEYYQGILKGAQSMVDGLVSGFKIVGGSIQGMLRWFQQLPGAINGAANSINNFNRNPPAPPPPVQQQRSDAGGTLVAFADNGVVSDSPQGLIAGNPGYTVSGGGKHHTGMGRRSQYRSEGDETYLYNAGGFRRLVKDFVLSIGGNTSVGVPSPAAGKARVGFDERGYGNFVEVLDELGRRIALVAHLSKASVSTGDMVKFGDTLGIQGYSGRTVPRGRGGTHVHAEMPPENWAPYMSGLRSGTFNQAPENGVSRGAQYAQQDYDRAVADLARLESEGAGTPRRNKKGRITGRTQAQLDAAFAKRIETAQRKVEMARRKLERFGDSAAARAQKAAEEAAQQEIDAVKTDVDVINSRAANRLSVIERDATLSPTESERQKNEARQNQANELKGLQNRIRELRAKYTGNPKLVTDIEGIATGINQAVAGAQQSQQAVERLSIAEVEQRIAEAIAANQSRSKNTDYLVSLGKLTEGAGAGEKSQDLGNTASELEKLLPMVRDLQNQYKDPESVNRLRAVTAVIQEQRIEANRLAKELTSGDYKALIDKTLAGADRQQQGIKNQRSLGNITDLEMEQQLLDLRLKTSDALDLLRPKLEALAAIQKDEGVKAAIEEQILAIKTYSAEAVKSSQEQAKAEQEKTLAYQLTRGAAEAVVDSSRSAFVNLGATIRDLGSLFDGLLNKIADVALGGLFDKFVKPGILGIFGLAHGTRGVGSIPNFANGVADALSRERAQSGKRPFLAALHEGEAVLSTLNGDSQLYNQMLRDGRWAMAKATPNYAYGTPSVARSAAGGGTARIVVDRINQVDYVTFEQVQQIVSVESPLIVEGSMGSLDQKMRSPGQRKRWGI